MIGKCPASQKFIPFCRIFLALEPVRIKMRLITGKISKKRGNINMKTSKKKEILSFAYKNH
jgi:hypothetical protein